MVHTWDRCWQCCWSGSAPPWPQPLCRRPPPPCSPSPGRLVAVGVVDVLPRCLSSKYLFWDPGGQRGGGGGGGVRQTCACTEGGSRAGRARGCVCTAVTLPPLATMPAGWPAPCHPSCPALPPGAAPSRSPPASTPRPPTHTPTHPHTHTHTHTTPPHPTPTPTRASPRHGCPVAGQADLPGGDWVGAGAGRCLPLPPPLLPGFLHTQLPPHALQGVGGWGGL